MGTAVLDVERYHVNYRKEVRKCNAGFPYDWDTKQAARRRY